MVLDLAQDICLDEFLGRTKAPLVAINYDAPGLRKTAKKTPTQRGQLDAAVQHASNLAKPQLAFKHAVNNSDEPWHPVLSHKFNAQVPLGHVYRDSDAETLMYVLCPLYPGCNQHGYEGITRIATK